MSAALSKACETLIEIKDQFEENQELVDAVLASDNAEDLLIAIGMAIAYTEEAITLNETGESHIKVAAKQLTEIAEEFEDGDE
jgi:hypothetical protein